MRRWKRLLLPAILALLLGACIVASYLFRGADSRSGPAKPSDPAGQVSPIDENPLQTARRLAAMADTADEQALAHEALRLADHELDEAFASALRQASAPAPPAKGPLKQLADRIAKGKARIAADQALIEKLNKNAAASDDLELAKARLALDQDELSDAQEDLAKQGGDQHSKLERLLQEHEATQHQTVQQSKSTAARTETLAEQVMAWFSLRERARQVESAQEQSTKKAEALERQHQTLENLIGGKALSTDQSGSTGDDAAAMLSGLRRLSDQAKTLTEFDKRIQDSGQLSDVYKRWNALLETRKRVVLHLLLISLAIVLAILLVVVSIDLGIRHAFDRQQDRKRRHHLRVIATLSVQFVGALGILLAIFGPPDQVSTLIGLATAGLTVALKDFIVAFIGWFVLMGKNGIRVGDWVEIEGVGGEVVEIGVLKTVLLEMGNWTNTGHPTGRRVTFMNKYAIENHYFNFSTAGAWLWDELQMTLPLIGDPYRMAIEIRNRVERETAEDALAAEHDWERVTHQYGTQAFSAKPAVDLRPSINGLEVIVRYITRAPQRYEVKSRLFEAIVGLVHKPVGSELPKS
jgi:small-conductance mechanosensitive channel